ncbi:hypothetical protein [Microvirga sp. VF16]|uniref:hypothetical protein n=1 Tax=Microvirga sp. VF16 TaxID=2807101 RepID=UPI00193EBBB5|nr:hypothetical protein [Microvirga sp. VF16]QRM35210.1 hypothetical protein JO965_40220 [Microvirga sp. VF16]
MRLQDAFSLVVSPEESPRSLEWIETGIKVETGKIGIVLRTVIETGATEIGEIGIETGTVTAVGVAVTAITKRVANGTASATSL